MIDVISHLHDPNVSKDSPFYSQEENRKYRQSKELSKSYLNASTVEGGYNNFIDNNIAMAIAGSLMNGSTSAVGHNDSTGSLGLSSPNGSLPNSPQHSRHSLLYQPINEETTRTLLACFLWVLGNVEQKLLRRFLTEFSNERLLTFQELLRLALRLFEYEGEKSFRKSSRFQLRRQSFHLKELEESIRYGTARRELMRRRDWSQSFGSFDNGDAKVRWRKDSTFSRYNSLPHNSVSYWMF